MWPFGKIACVVCGERLSKHELKISLQDEKIAVCRYCFEGWWIRGRKYGRCREQIAGAQAIAVFPEQRGIGLDCGGVPLSS